MNVGKSVIEWLYTKKLSVDRQWSLWDDDGFTWWADKNAQRIEVIRRDYDPALGESFMLRVRTEFLSDLSLDEGALKGIGAFLMPLASMCGPVYDSRTRCLSLSSLVRIHEGNKPWMSQLIAMATVIQIGEARLMGPKLTEIIGGRFAASGHPQNGVRPQPDEMASVVTNFLGPLGKEPAAWTDPDFQDAVDSCMMQPPSLGATCGGAGLTVEFPYGDFSSLCRMKADEEHPLYGNGLHVRQSFPVRAADDLEGTKLALELNSEELETDAAGYGFGSYCYEDQVIHFCSFLPNPCYQEGLIKNWYTACAVRARRLSKRFCNDDWPELQPPGNVEKFYERMARRLERLKSRAR